METISLWNKPNSTVMEYYPANKKTHDTAIVIYPGGGYTNRAAHEGQGYAAFFNEQGYDAFVVEYRVSPNRFPLPLLDARRAVRYVRANAGKYGVNPNKIVVMGSSAGGHLAAMTSTYRKPVEGEGCDETDSFDCTPNACVLCYPVIHISNLAVTHIGSCVNLLGTDNLAVAQDVDPCLMADAKTPPTFIWHTSDDNCVNIINSLRYGEALKKQNLPFELHVFPNGRHGLGLSTGASPEEKHVAEWSRLLLRWLSYLGF
ncbi:MAG: alpha/beta hydrolase [Clostridia bacterium]|nr:alpha/beta hydrolase [Clostridia bacterium]